MIEYDGMNWYLTTKGYYARNMSNQIRNVLLHRYVWKKYYGEIPNGYDIHHQDYKTNPNSKANNEISNLLMLSHSKHVSLHNTGGHRNLGKKHTPETIEKIKVQRAKQTMSPWTDERREKFKETIKISAAYQNRTRPIKYPTTPEMLEDVKNGISQRAFKVKYGLSNRVWSRVRIEIGLE